MVDAMKPGQGQIAARWGLAMVYCYQKSDRGFAIMESLVPKLNELVEASAKLDGLERRYLRDGEWNMTGEGPLASSNRTGPECGLLRTLRFRSCGESVISIRKN